MEHRKSANRISTDFRNDSAPENAGETLLSRACVSQIDVVYYTVSKTRLFSFFLSFQSAHIIIMGERRDKLLTFFFFKSVKWTWADKLKIYWW